MLIGEAEDLLSYIETYLVCAVDTLDNLRCRGLRLLKDFSLWVLILYNSYDTSSGIQTGSISSWDSKLRFCNLSGRSLCLHRS
jgi:hypothetical protein